MSFGTIAADYDRYRPGPTAEVVEWLLPSDASVVVDLGAGTGALTRLLVERVQQVISVEPDARMRAVLSERCPQAIALEGRGDAIPVDDGVADAVLVSSAWHWMDVEPTLAEIARVLRSRGRLGIVWAGPDRSVGWFGRWLRRARDASGLPDELRRSVSEAGLDDPSATGAGTGGGNGEAARRGPASERHRLVLPADAPFSPPEFVEISWSRTMTTEDLVGLAGTYSGIITLPETARGQMLQLARSWLEEQPELAGSGQVELPFRAVCWRTDRLD